MSNQFRLLLFIVVISGALCTVEDYVIMSQCAHNKAIHVAAEGTVSVTDISQTQNITIVGLPDYVNNNLKIALYAKETQRYLCFNDQWKLVGMKELRDTCYFNETIVHGYFVFRSVVDLQRRVGFTHRGKAVGPKKNVNDACYLFTKIQADQFFHQHTDYFAPKSKSTKIISGIANAPQTTTATHTTSGASARSASQRAALSAAATTATVTATAAQRNYNSNNRLLRTNNKNKRVNGVRSSNSSNNNNRNSNNNQNEEYTNGHSSNLSSSSNNNNNCNQSSNINHNNSSNLVSNSQQQVDLSQQKQHNNNSNGRTREHVRQQQQHQQQQHQVRHHHNDPNLIARRQHHEHKQKRRQHQRQQQRLRSGKITSPATTTVAQERASATTTTRAIYSTTATGAVAHSKQQHEKDARHEPQPATVANVAAKAATATSIIMKSTTTIANKRKGRRRKGRKQRKQQQAQRAQQQMLPLVARESTKAAHTPTPTAWLWSDSPTPSLSSLSTQMLADVPSSLSPATTFGDYSGEWQTAVPTNVDSAASLSATPTLSTLASDTPTAIYLASTTDLSDGSSSLTPTSDYNNNTDFTSIAPADEESSLNATLITEIDESRMWPEPTIALDEQLNSITSEQQQQFTTQNVATPVSTAESIAPTSTTWSESSEQNWSSSTPTNDTDDLETAFPSPTAIVDTESVAATAIFSEDGNVTEETQTFAEATDLYATINSTSSEIEAESSSSTHNDDGNTEALTEVGDTQSTTTAQRKVHSLPAERGNIGHMWRKQSGIAASIATLLHQQLLATSASSGNVYAWRPQRGEEYSDELIVATGRPVAAELETTTDVASGDRATWWQHHMNHSGTNFWDKGIADEVPNSGDDADLDWLKHLTKQRTASKRRHNNRKANNNSSRDVEAVSQPPLQALSTSVSSLSFGKKYVPEVKTQRQSSKAHSGSNKLPAATTTAHEYSSTMATSRSSSATTHSAGVITPATTTARLNDNTLATTTTTQHLYPLQQLLGNKTILPLHNPPALVHFDGNSNHLAHTHTPTVSTLSTTTSAAAPTSTTVAGDATTAVAALTTKKSIRISTQKLLATPFHQLTYVRNNAGDIDIDNMDNISVYPDLLEESGELAEQRSTERAETDATRNSRLTIVSGYLPTSATATLPESIRLAKVKINKERKRMMSLRKRHSRRHA